MNYKCSLCKSDFVKSKKLIDIGDELCGTYYCSCVSENDENLQVLYIFKDNKINYSISNSNYKLMCLLASSYDGFMIIFHNYHIFYKIYDNIYFDLVIKDNIICIDETIEKFLNVSLLI